MNWRTTGAQLAQLAHTHGAEAPSFAPSPVETAARRPCLACLNLTESWRCMAAARGALPGAAWDYRPVDWPPRRCPEFFPHPNDPDQRHGRERWPWLTTPSVEVTP